MVATGDAPGAIVEREGLKQVTDTGAIEKVIDEVIAANADQVEQVKAQKAAGHDKPKALGWFVGQIMKASGGKANPAAVNEILLKKLGL
jgi:aspartyl-tRNA(Asn)/glutamyl-tRNA(Gln) amidotransferase subunit B